MYLSISRPYDSGMSFSNGHGASFDDCDEIPVVGPLVSITILTGPSPYTTGCGEGVGQGSFGCVYLAYHYEFGIVAAKIIEIDKLLKSFQTNHKLPSQVVF
ncbi:MAG: hypothetical protein EZS28_034570 [Streblomastix strix]|uniref:Protein kinase domain-containing protein n=1 Tax=Streblomastix strix TaxID=222440 RepID=A0A5J4UJ29_9EUKA|nr:MAG: hypothetical protein EZS28_034570 [Streblomastix strix]